MDKYGVATAESHTKTASKTKSPCPKCGHRNVNYAGQVPHCPTCGTEPWEPQPRGR